MNPIHKCIQLTQQTESVLFWNDNIPDLWSVGLILMFLDVTVHIGIFVFCLNYTAHMLQLFCMTQSVCDLYLYYMSTDHFSLYMRNNLIS